MSATPPILRVVLRACEMQKPIDKQWAFVQKIETGLIVGNIGPNKDGVISFAPDGCAYTLSAKALRDIADFIETHGVAVAS